MTFRVSNSLTASRPWGYQPGGSMPADVFEPAGRCRFGVA